jgi:hypothetical protein
MKRVLLDSLVITVTLVMFLVAHSYIKARKWNEVTGNSVSTWDAMFIHYQIGGVDTRGREVFEEKLDAMRSEAVERGYGVGCGDDFRWIDTGERDGE